MATIVEAAGIEPAHVSSEGIVSKRLTKTAFAKSVDLEHADGPQWPNLTSIDADDACDDRRLQHVTRAWPCLPAHIRDAILTLVDSALTMQSSGLNQQ